MSSSLPEYDDRVHAAVVSYWDVRRTQAERSRDLGVVNTGLRAEVTGGRHMNALELLLVEVLVDAGIPAKMLQVKKRPVPGYFRRDKSWDVVGTVSDRVVAIIELKSIVGTKPSRRRRGQRRGARQVAADSSTMTLRSSGSSSVHRSSCGPSIVLVSVRVAEPFDGLPGDFGNELEVLVNVQHGELCQFCHGGDEQIGNGGCPVLASLGEDGLDLDGAILDRRGEVLHGHRPQRGGAEGVTKVASRASGEADFEQCHAGDAGRTNCCPGR